MLSLNVNPFSTESTMGLKREHKLDGPVPSGQMGDTSSTFVLSVQEKEESLQRENYINVCDHLHNGDKIARRLGSVNLLESKS